MAILIALKRRPVVKIPVLGYICNCKHMAVFQTMQIDLQHTFQSRLCISLPSYFLWENPRSFVTINDRCTAWSWLFFKISIDLQASKRIHIVSSRWKRLKFLSFGNWFIFQELEMFTHTEKSMETSECYSFKCWKLSHLNIIRAIYFLYTAFLCTGGGIFLEFLCLIGKK